MSRVRNGQRERGIGRGRLAAIVAAVLAVGSAVPAAAQSPDAPPVPGAETPGEDFRPRLVREGTLSLGGQAQYGTLLATTGWGRDYDAGPGMAVRVRYRTGRETALGMSFEAQRFNAAESPVSAFDPKWIRAIVTTVEYYQFFRVRQRAARYVMAGAGLAQPRRRLQNGEIDLGAREARDAGVLALGGGTEVWWKRWFTVDLSLRYYGFVRSDGAIHLSHNVQAAAGLHFYTSR